MSAVLGGSLPLLDLLLAHGADVDARDPHGWTPLHFAAQEVLPEMAARLLARGADVNAQDDEGNTPLARAIFFARGRHAIIDLLRKHGAKDDVPNLAGETPRELAARIGAPVFTRELAATAVCKISTLTPSATADRRERKDEGGPSMFRRGPDPPPCGNFRGV